MQARAGDGVCAGLAGGEGRCVLGIAAAARAVIRKDVLLEWRGRARINATIFFAGLTLLLFSFAVGPRHEVLQTMAPGFLWLAVLLASVLTLSESMRLEMDNAALEGLRLLPVKPQGIFLGKALVNSLFLFVLALLLTPLSVAIYSAQIRLGVGSLVMVLALGTCAISAPGTLYAAIATQARARDLLLPLLLFPILVPGLLASVKATDLVYNGDAMGQLGSWLRLMLGFNVVYWILCTLLFGRVIEE